MAIKSKARHDLTLRSIKREIGAGRDVAFWLDKAYTHYDNGLLDEADIAEVETLAQAHQLDGLVLIPNCDKIVPGMLMAAARLNIPSILVSGGPMLAGHFGGEEVSLSKTFEAVGAYKAGMMDEETFYEAECNSCPGCAHAQACTQQTR